MMPAPHSSQVPRDSSAKLACPNCGDAPTQAFDNLDHEGVTTTYCLCGASHLWSVRWTAA